MSCEFLGSDADSQTRELHTERCGALLVATLELIVPVPA